jgi:hypothetical protein
MVNSKTVLGVIPKMPLRKAVYRYGSWNTVSCLYLASGYVGIDVGTFIMLRVADGGPEVFISSCTHIHIPLCCTATDFIAVYFSM